MRTAELEPVLTRVRDGTVELLSEITSRPQSVDASCLYGDFPVERQVELARQITARLPLQPGTWRIDETVHPFATGIGISDLRITTRFEPGYVGTSLWAVIHEVGHALYQNGIAAELERTPCAARPRSASTSRRAGFGRTGSDAAARSSPTSTRCSPSSSRSASPAPIARRSTGPRTAFSRR